MTPPGRGAVATLRIEGSGAVDAVQAVFRARGGRPLGEYPPDRIVVGRSAATAGAGRGGRRLPARRRCRRTALPRRTGGRRGHRGGAGAAGGRPITWREWAEGQSNDPIAAAAIVALAEACTQRTAAILLDQYHGALRRAIAEIRAGHRRRRRRAGRRTNELLLSWSVLGQHLTRPWSVVLAGRRMWARAA